MGAFLIKTMHNQSTFFEFWHPFRVSTLKILASVATMLLLIVTGCSNDSQKSSSNDQAGYSGPVGDDTYIPDFEYDGLSFSKIWVTQKGYTGLPYTTSFTITSETDQKGVYVKLSLVRLPTGNLSELKAEKQTAYYDIFGATTQADTTSVYDLSFIMNDPRRMVNDEESRKDDRMLPEIVPVGAAVFDLVAGVPRNVTLKDTRGDRYTLPVDVAPGTYAAIFSINDHPQGYATGEVSGMDNSGRYHMAQTWASDEEQGGSAYYGPAMPPPPPPPGVAATPISSEECTVGGLGVLLCSMEYETDFATKNCNDRISWCSLYKLTDDYCDTTFDECFQNSIEAANCVCPETKSLKSADAVVTISQPNRPNLRIMNANLAENSFTVRPDIEVSKDSGSLVVSAPDIQLNLEIEAQAQDVTNPVKVAFQLGIPDSGTQDGFDWETLRITTYGPRSTVELEELATAAEAAKTEAEANLSSATDNKADAEALVAQKKTALLAAVNALPLDKPDYPTGWPETLIAESSSLSGAYELIIVKGMLECLDARMRYERHYNSGRDYFEYIESCPVKYFEIVSTVVPKYAQQWPLVYSTNDDLHNFDAKLHTAMKAANALRDEWVNAQAAYEAAVVAERTAQAKVDEKTADAERAAASVADAKTGPPVYNGQEAYSFEASEGSNTVVSRGEPRGKNFEFILHADIKEKLLALNADAVCRLRIIVNPMGDGHVEEWSGTDDNGNALGGPGDNQLDLRIVYLQKRITSADDDPAFVSEEEYNNASLTRAGTRADDSNLAWPEVEDSCGAAEDKEENQAEKTNELQIETEDDANTADTDSANTNTTASENNDDDAAEPEGDDWVLVKVPEADGTTVTIKVDKVDIEIGEEEDAPEGKEETKEEPKDDEEASCWHKPDSLTFNKNKVFGYTLFRYPDNESVFGFGDPGTFAMQLDLTSYITYAKKRNAVVPYKAKFGSYNSLHGWLYDQAFSVLDVNVQAQINGQDLINAEETHFGYEVKVLGQKVYGSWYFPPSSEGKPVLLYTTKDTEDNEKYVLTEEYEYNWFSIIVVVPVFATAQVKGELGIRGMVYLEPENTLQVYAGPYASLEGYGITGVGYDFGIITYGYAFEARVKVIEFETYFHGKLQLLFDGTPATAHLLLEAPYYLGVLSGEIGVWAGFNVNLGIGSFGLDHRQVLASWDPVYDVHGDWFPRYQKFWGNGMPSEAEALVFDFTNGQATYIEQESGPSTSYNGIVQGALLYPDRFDNHNQALMLDGVNDVVSLESTPFDLGSENEAFTLSFWAFPIENTNMVDVANDFGGHVGQKYAFFPAQGTIRWGGTLSGLGVAVGKNGVNVCLHRDNYISCVLSHQKVLDHWANISLVSEYNEESSKTALSLYINGQLVSETEVSNRVSLYLGADGIGGGSFGSYAGLLDDIRIFKKAYGGKELMALYGENGYKGGGFWLKSEGLEAHYPFSGNANDEHSNDVPGASDILVQHTTTVQGATLAVDRFGTSDASYFFDGDDDYIDISGIPIDAQNNFTVSLWVKPDPGTPDVFDWQCYLARYEDLRNAGYDTETEATSHWTATGQTEGRIGGCVNDIELVSESDAGVAVGQKYVIPPADGGTVWGNDSHSGVGISVGSNGVSVCENSTGYRPCLLVYATAIDAWTNVTVTYANGTPSLYINGNYVRTGVASRKAYQHLYLGASVAIGGNSLGRYQGAADDMRVYSRVLSAKEIDEMYHDGSWDVFPLPISSSGLVAYYPFNNGLDDYEVNRMNLVREPKGTGRFGSDRFGINYYALSLDTTDSFSFADDDDRIDLDGTTAGFTVSFWAKPNKAIKVDFTENAHGIDVWNTTQSYVIQPVYMGGRRNPGAYPDADEDVLRNHAGVGISVGSNGIVLTEESHVHMPALLVQAMTITDWTHIVVTFSSRTPSVYINGVHEHTGKASEWDASRLFIGIGLHGGGETYIGGQGESGYTGLLDDLRIYNRVLSDTEIEGLYQ